MFGAIIPAPFAIPPIVIVRPPARILRIPRFGKASVVQIASPAVAIPVGERRAARPGRAATILSTGSGTPMTPVEPIRSESTGRPRAAPAARDVSRTARFPTAPVQAFALPLFATIPRSRDRVRSALPQTTGAAATLFRVNTTADTQGRSLTTSARSGFPDFLIPHDVPAPRNPGTMISFGSFNLSPLRTRYRVPRIRSPLCVRAAAFLVLLSGPAGAGVVPADLDALALLRGLPRALDVPAGEDDAGRTRGGHPFLHFGPLLFALHLDVEQAPEGFLLDPRDQVREKIEPFPLVLLERILLGVPAQADPLLEVIHRQEVVLPQRVHRGEEKHPLEVPDRLGSVVGLLLRVERLRPRPYPVREVGRRKLDPLRLRDLRPESELRVDGGGQRLDVPLLRVRFLVGEPPGEILRDLPGEVEHHLAEVLASQDLPTHVVDHRALLVHHVVVFEKVLPDVEVVPLDLLLGVLDRTVDQRVLDRLALLHPQLLHDRGDPVGAEDPEQVVLERKVEARGARVALSSRAAAKLVVHPAGLVALRPDDVEPPLPDDALAQLDVHTAAGHVRGDGHPSRMARLGDDLRLLLVVLGVQDVVGNAVAREQPGEPLGLLDRDGPH